MVQSLKESLVYEAVEEVHLLRSVLKHISYNILNHALSKYHIILKVCKRHLRLNHPELSSMPCCVGVLCTEGRAECINVLECHRIGLAVKLTAYRKISRLSKEILGIIDLAVLCLRNIVQIHGCYLEHLACTLAVTSSDQWSVHIYKALLLEELMNSKCDQRTNTENCLEGVCTRTQMGNGTQIFHAVTLLL